MLIFLIEDVSRNIWSFILAQSYCTPLAKKKKKERRKLWQADYQRPSSFLKFFKVKIDSLRICQRHRTCIYKRDRTEIPLSKLTNIENREKVPTILKESSGKKRKKKMLQNKDHDEPLRPLFTLRSHPFAYFMSCIENAKSRLIANKAFLVL